MVVTAANRTGFDDSTASKTIEQDHTEDSTQHDTGHDSDVYVVHGGKESRVCVLAV